MSSASRSALGVFVCCAAASCNEHPLKSAELGVFGEERGSVCTPDPPKVDVLLVIDDSASMADELAVLAENLPRIMRVYDDEFLGLDYRIAVTTTDVAHPHCDTESEDGALVVGSCRERVADFVASASHESGAIDLRQTCLDACELETIETLPTTTAYDAVPRPRPWLERSRGRHNVPFDVSMADALACRGLVGVSGCTFESPLEAAYLALLRASDVADSAYGFLRPDAALFVLFVTDEGDCSVRPEHLAIFEGDDAPTSAVCWNAAVECSGGPGVYDDCPAVDEDASGARVEPDDAVLHPVSRYIELLRGIEMAKQHALATNEPRVFSHVVGGVPLQYGNGVDELFFADARDAAMQLAFGIGPGCASTQDVFAMPPVRLREVTAEFAEFAEVPLFSICGTDFTNALACVPGGGWRTPSPGCLDGCARDLDPGKSGVQSKCTLTERRTSDDESRPIRECIAFCGGAPCPDDRVAEVDDWVHPAGEDACVIWQADDDLADECIDRGTNLGYEIVRRTEVWEGACIEVTCASSRHPESDCPTL